LNRSREEAPGHHRGGRLRSRQEHCVPPRDAAPPGEVRVLCVGPRSSRRGSIGRQSHSLERLGIEADFIAAGLRLEGIGPVREAMQVALDQPEGYASAT